MYRSIAVDAGSPAAAFLATLQRDLYRFGREDAVLVTIGNLTLFVWRPAINAMGSKALREASLADRLAGQRARLEATEAKLPEHFFEPFDVDLHAIDPEIIVCARRSSEEMVFNYVANGQSVAAETSQMRIGKFLVYDRSRSPRRLMGIIGLKSPMYFDGARDAHLGWPRLFNIVNGQRVRDNTAFELRNRALKSIYNVCVCMLTVPYAQHRIGRLLSSFCFAPAVIEYLETTYGDPVLGLTTTGGWGGSAAQYERIRLAAPRNNKSVGEFLFVKTYGAKPSLAYPFHLFGNDVFELAFAMLKASHQPAREFANYPSDPHVRRKMLLAAGRFVGLPRAAFATNLVAHYFGTVSKRCSDSLASLSGLAAPPATRTIAVGDAMAEWRGRVSQAYFKNVQVERLSTLAS